MSAREIAVRRLRRGRPRNRGVTLSMIVVIALAAYSWTSGEMRVDDLFSAQRAHNAQRFLSEIVPYPLQGRAFDAHDAIAWMRERMEGDGWHAALVTLAISIVAIVLAGLGGAVACLPAARNFAYSEGFAPSSRRPTRLGMTLSAAVVALTRGVLIFLRAVPEYIWAFLLIKMLGFNAWPAVLALAIHNTGILGKLMAETVEDIEPNSARALRILGARRSQIALAAVLPDVLPRFLLYFFYRWETCMREATVLGMLGVVSLGSLIRDARAANFYDEMTFYVLVGAALVLVADLTSALARSAVRRAV